MKIIDLLTKTDNHVQSLLIKLGSQEGIRIEKSITLKIKDPEITKLRKLKKTAENKLEEVQEENQEKTEETIEANKKGTSIGTDNKMNILPRKILEKEITDSHSHKFTRVRMIDLAPLSKSAN